MDSGFDTFTSKIKYLKQLKFKTNSDFRPKADFKISVSSQANVIHHVTKTKILH